MHRLFASIFDSLLSSSKPHHIHDLNSVRAAYLKCGLQPANLPMPFIHLLIDASPILSTLFVDLQRLRIRPTLDTCQRVMAAAARIANPDDCMRALTWLRTEAKQLQLGVVEYNGFLRAFAARGELNGAMYVFDDMVRSGMRGDDDTFRQLLHAAGRAGQSDLGLSLLEHIRTTAEVRADAAPAVRGPSEPPTSASDAPSAQADSAPSHSPSSGQPLPGAASPLPPPPSSSPSYPLSSVLFEALLSGLLAERGDSGAAALQALSSAHSILNRQRAYHAQGVAPPPSLSAYSSLISAYRRSAQPGPAYQLYVEMRTEGHLLPPSDFNALLTLIGQQSDDGLRLALSLLKERIEAHRVAGLAPVLVSTFNAVIGLCRQRDKVDHISTLLQHMQQLGVERDLTTFHHLIELYGAHDLHRALQLYHQLLAAPLSPDIHTFHLLLAAASDTRRVVWAILQDLQRSGVCPQERTFLLALQSAESNARTGSCILPFFYHLKHTAMAHTAAQAAAAASSSSFNAVSSLTAATSSVPKNLVDREPYSPTLPPSASDSAPLLSPSLTRSTYIRHVEALSKSGPHPLPILLAFLEAMKRAQHDLTRQLLKDLVLSYATRDDLHGCVALLRLMTTEGVGFDADVVNCMVRLLPVARLDEYARAIDERLVQAEQNEEQRAAMLTHLFQGLCDARATAPAERILRLMAERGMQVSARQLQELLSSLDTGGRDYIAHATRLLALTPSLSLSPSLTLFTPLTSHVHSVHDVDLVLAQLRVLGVQGDASFYFQLLERLMSLPASGTQLLQPVSSIFDELTRQQLVLSESELHGLHEHARAKRMAWLCRRMWLYMDALQLPVSPRRLLIHAQMASLSENMEWVADIARYLEQSPAAADSIDAALPPPPVAATPSAVAAASSRRSAPLPALSGAAAVYEELLLAQERLFKFRFPFRLWLQMRRSGAERLIGSSGRLYSALCRAVQHARAPGFERLLSDERAALRQLLQPARAAGSGTAPATMTAELVATMERLLREDATALTRGELTRVSTASNLRASQPQPPPARPPPPAASARTRPQLGAAVRQQPQQPRRPVTQHHHSQRSRLAR